MKRSETEDRRVYHRQGFEAQLLLKRLDDRMIEYPEQLRASIKHDLRMLHWLQLDNQYVFVRDSALRNKPVFSPLIRLVDAKLNFLVAEIFGRDALETPIQRVEMSATGISFDWPEALPEESLWLVTVDPEGVEAPLKVPAIVQRIAQGVEPSSTTVALKFLALTEEETDALASWIVAREAQELSKNRSPDKD